MLGPALFDQSLVVYLMFLAVPAVWYALFRTRWGLRLRAVGEHPKAADTVGIKVERTRYRGLLVAGGIVGGRRRVLHRRCSVRQFGKNMTGGAGYIALAAVIFGKWDPVRAAFAALLFGFASNLQNVLSVVGSPVPSQFMLMLPYVVTLLAVAGLVGRSRAPGRVGRAVHQGVRVPSTGSSCADRPDPSPISGAAAGCRPTPTWTGTHCVRRPRT